MDAQKAHRFLTRLTVFATTIAELSILNNQQLQRVSNVCTNVATVSIKALVLHVMRLTIDS